MNLASTCCRHLSSSVVVGGVAPRSAQVGTDENPGVMDIGIALAIRVRKTGRDT